MKNLKLVLLSLSLVTTVMHSNSQSMDKYNCEQNQQYQVAEKEI